MKRTIIIVVIIGMFGWAIYDFVVKSDDPATSKESDQSEDTETIGLEVGNVAPDFELETLEGEMVKLSDYRGERVMVNFWATWCPPCRAEIPDMQKFHEKTDIQILAINLTDTESDKDKVPTFVKNFGMTFKVLMDESSEVANQYQIQPIPTSYMIDSNGVIQFKAMGAMNYDSMVREFEKMN
ncbi:MAG TPA: TlpA disulfide reductase family protein [Bacillota bacterium]